MSPDTIVRLNDVKVQLITFGSVVLLNSSEYCELGTYLSYPGVPDNVILLLVESFQLKDIDWPHSALK